MEGAENMSSLENGEKMDECEKPEAQITDDQKAQAEEMKNDANEYFKSKFT